MKALKIKKITVVVLSIGLEVGLLVFNLIVSDGKCPGLNHGLAALAAYGWLTIGMLSLMAAFSWFFEDEPKKSNKQQHRSSNSNKQQQNAAEWWAEQAKRDQFFADYEKAYRSL